MSGARGRTAELWTREDTNVGEGLRAWWQALGSGLQERQVREAQWWTSRVEREEEEEAAKARAEEKEAGAVSSLLPSKGCRVGGPLEEGEEEEEERQQQQQTDRQNVRRNDMREKRRGEERERERESVCEGREGGREGGERRRE